jgi:hypothetical protein
LNNEDELTHLDGCVRIDPMGVVQVDRIDTQTAQRLIRCLSYIFSISTDAGRSEAKFRGDEDVVPLACFLEPSLVINVGR